jgi:hypothetical protein
VKKAILLIATLAAVLILGPLLMALIVAGIVAPAVISTLDCGQEAPVASTGGWRPPFQQRYTRTSPFGRRFHPIYKEWRLHTGQTWPLFPARDQ